NKIKEKLFEFFVQQFLERNRIIANINMTFISFSNKEYYRLSDDNTDIHNKFLLAKYYVASTGSCQADDINSLRKTKYQIGFFVSNIELSEHAKNELINSTFKDRICICSQYEIVDKIRKYEYNLNLKQQKFEKKKYRTNL
ncbi:34612_t:CDS:2, partial [Gigaspora margarita]